MTCFCKENVLRERVLYIHAIYINKSRESLYVCSSDSTDTERPRNSDSSTTTPNLVYRFSTGQELYIKIAVSELDLFLCLFNVLAIIDQIFAFIF